MSINPDSIEFYNIRDSVTTKQPFTCSLDPASLRKFIITTKWEENLQYRLLLKPGQWRIFTGLKNDTVAIKFATQQMEYYGRIIVTTQGTKLPVILQVMDEKGRFRKQKI